MRTRSSEECLDIAMCRLIAAHLFGLIHGKQSVCLKKTTTNKTKDYGGLKKTFS